MITCFLIEGYDLVFNKGKVDAELPDMCTNDNNPVGFSGGNRVDFCHVPGVIVDFVHSSANAHMRGGAVLPCCQCWFVQTFKGLLVEPVAASDGAAVKDQRSRKKLRVGRVAELCAVRSRNGLHGGKLKTVLAVARTVLFFKRSAAARLQKSSAAAKKSRSPSPPRQAFQELPSIGLERILAVLFSLVVAPAPKRNPVVRLVSGVLAVPREIVDVESVAACPKQAHAGRVRAADAAAVPYGVLQLAPAILRDTGRYESCFRTGDGRRDQARVEEGRAHLLCS